MRERFSFVIDVVGACNLKCPSCPVGNFQEIGPTPGRMEPELLDRIITKAKRECDIDYIALYNWTEPMLHPKLPDLIRVISGHGERCFLSSNLNILRDSDELFRAGVAKIRVSVSGFEQETYGVTHRYGDIEKVKRNMAELAESRRRTGSDARLELAFHRYLGNHEEERSMRAFAEPLGFKFVPTWAYFMPLEKLLAYLGDGSTRAVITDDDRRLIERLALKPDEAAAAALPFREKPCALRENQMALDHEGRVMLCCTVFDKDAYGLGRFLDIPLAELQRLKHANPLCGPCMDRGLHVVATYGAQEMEAAAQRRVREKYPEAKLQNVLDRRGGRIRRLFRKIRGAVSRGA